MNKYHPNNMEEFFFKSSGIRRPFPSSFGTIIIYGRPFVSKIRYRPHSIRYPGMAILEYINSIIELIYQNFKHIVFDYQMQWFDSHFI